MVTAKDINDGRILYEQARRTSRDAFIEKLTDKSRPKIGDVLVTKDGTLGRIAIVDRPDVCVNQSVAVLQRNSSIRPAFLKLVLEEPRNHQRMLSEAEGSTIKHIYVTRLAKQPVRVPPLIVQDLVLSIITPLERKIELNRKMNATLEAMARALFRDWFVDFGPTRTKMAGQTPYLSPDLWSLFPARLYAEGKPEGWEVRPVGEVIELFDHKRVPLSSQERAKRQGPYPYHGATSVMDHIDGYLFDERLLLLGEDGSVAQADGRPFTQYVWGKLWVNNHAHVIKGLKVSVEQLKLFFDQVDIRPFVTGAVQPKLNQKNLRRVPYLRASDGVHSAFDAAIGPLYDLIRHQNEESRTLAQTRDLLLPRLMSGELRVADLQEVS